MQGRLLLVESQTVEEVASWLEGLGFGPLLVNQRQVCGAEIWPAVEAAQAGHPDGPVTSFALTKTGRWTLISDLDAALIDELDVAAAFSKKTGQRVLAVSLDDAASSLQHFNAGERTRALEQSPHGLVAVGERLALEELFRSNTRLEPDDLLSFLQGLGIDVTRLNLAAEYVLLVFES